MPSDSTAADRLLEGDRSVAAALATGLLKPQRDNLVERPWGGARLCEFKGLTAAPCATGRPFGESFEISADDGDDEARLHPSVLTLADGSMITLPALLAVHAETVLGEAFVERYGRRFPLLPKLLDVAELLSVQAHPPGNTEVYVIVDADPGATIRLGFAADVDAGLWTAKLAGGLRDQQRLLEPFGAEAADHLQAVLKPWLARRGATPAELEAALRPLLADGGHWTDVEARLSDVTRRLLGGARLVECGSRESRRRRLQREPGAGGGRKRQTDLGRGARARQSRRARRAGARDSAAWHDVSGVGQRALPAARYRHRCNARSVELDGDSTRGVHGRAEASCAPACGGPSTRSTSGSSISSRRRCWPSIFRRPTPHTLHALAGRVDVLRPGGEILGTLERGESALVPAKVGAYRLVADGEPAALVKVDLPPYVD